MRKLQRILEYGKTYGVREMMNKSAEFLTGRRIAYEKWFQKHRASSMELEHQRKEQWEDAPLVSIIVTAY